jgi:hypothetical protein
MRLLDFNRHVIYADNYYANFMFILRKYYNQFSNQLSLGGLNILCSENNDCYFFILIINFIEHLTKILEYQDQNYKFTEQLFLLT